MRTIDSLPRKQGRKPTHDWDTILNGDVNVLGFGEDFTSCTVDSFISQARGAAATRGLSLTAIKVPESEGGRVGNDGTIKDGEPQEVLLDVAVKAREPEADDESADEEE